MWQRKTFDPGERVRLSCVGIWIIALGFTTCGWADSVDAANQPLVLVQAVAGETADSARSPGSPGGIPRVPAGAAPVPIPIPVPVPPYVGAPAPYGSPYGYGGYPYVPYGHPYRYSSPGFGHEPYTGPKAGHIQLVVDPVDAQVFIDGHEVKQQSDFTYVVNLLEGRHRLQIAREGFKPYDQPLDVPGGGGFVLAVRLEK